MRNDTGWYDASTARKRAQIQVQKDYEGVQMKSSREQFVEWFNEIMKPAMEKIDIDWPERRLVNDVSWIAWQASRAAIEIELPDVCAWNLCELLDKKEVVESIRAAGLTVKGDL